MEAILLLAAYLQRLASEGGRFVALFSVGIAWAAVPYLAVFFRHDPRILVEPRLLPVLSAADGLLMIATPVLALVGIAVVSRLLFTDSTRDGTSLIALALASGGLLLIPTLVAPSWDSTSMILAGLGFIGAIVTALAFWRRSRLAALAWSLLFAVPLVGLVTTSQTRMLEDPELVAGMRVFALWIATLIAIYLAAMVAFFMPARATTEPTT